MNVANNKHKEMHGLGNYYFHIIISLLYFNQGDLLVCNYNPISKFHSFTIIPFLNFLLTMKTNQVCKIFRIIIFESNK